MSLVSPVTLISIVIGCAKRNSRFKIYYIIKNFVNLHQSLKGRIPAKGAEITCT